VAKFASQKNAAPRSFVTYDAGAVTYIFVKQFVDVFAAHNFYRAQGFTGVFANQAGPLPESG
jgi:hypothetical protein